METFSKDRVEIFSDAVIAIALTLLVLELHPPEVADHASISQYFAAMGPVIPKFASFVLSFATIAIHWVSHHYFFRHLKGMPVGMVWLNNLFLLWICFLPFPTALLGDHPTGQFPILLYSGTSLLLALTFLALRAYATQAKLFKQEGEYANSMGPKHSLPAVTLYGLSVLLVFVSVYASLACLLLIPFLYFAPTVVQSLRRKVRG